MNIDSKLPPEGINSKSENPLPEFLWLVVVLGVGAVGLYAGLGVLADRWVQHLSPKTEKKMVSKIAFATQKLFGEEKKNPTLTALVKELASHADLGTQIDVFESCQETVNAFALPGGKIVVLGGLIAQTKSQEELAFVLAHELGHFYHRHHLKGLGRGVLFMGLSSVLGFEWPLMGNMGQVVNMQFSQQQELQADAFGAQVFVGHYGHATGIKDFFEKTKHKEQDQLFVKWMASHPLSEKRISELNVLIDQNKWKRGSRTPLEKTSICKGPLEPTKG